MTTLDLVQKNGNADTYIEACNQYHRDVFKAEDHLDSGDHEAALTLLNNIQTRDLSFLDAQERPDLHLIGYIKALETPMPKCVSMNKDELYKIISRNKSNPSLIGQMVDGFISGVIDRIDGLNMITINSNNLSVIR